MEEFTVGEFVLVTIVGAGVGLIAGLFGIGGGFLIVPALNMLLGLPMQIAVGSAACQVLGPATTSVLARRVAWDELRLPLIVAGGLFAGVFAGAGVLNHLTESSRAGTAAIWDVETVVLAIYLCLLLVLGLFALWESGRELAHKPIPVGWLALVPLSPKTQIEGVHQPLSIVVLAWFGLGVGFLSGLLGISGGLLLLPGLVYLIGLDWQRAVTASMLIVWCVAVQSTIAHSLHDHIRLVVVIGLLLGGTFGARIGVEWSSRVHPVRGRQSFGWLALVTAATIGLKLLT